MRLTTSQTRDLRNVARALAVAGWLAFVAASAGPDLFGSSQESDPEYTARYVFAAIAAAFILVSWLSPGFGGTLLVLAGVILGIAVATEYTQLTAMAVALLLVVPGVLFLISWAGRQHSARQLLVATAVAAVIAFGVAVARETHHQAFGASHPQSSLEVQPFDDVEWVWSGAVTSTGFTVSARIDGEAGAARLVVSTSRSLMSPIYTRTVEVDKAPGKVVSLRVDDLSPGTRYYYAVEVDGELDTQRRGSASTFPAAGTTFSVLVGSCGRTGSNGLVYEAMRDQDALLYIITGDFHYEDITSNDVGRFRDAYTTAITSPAQQALYSETPIAYVWDDHDFGGGNSDGLTPAREAARIAYRENVPHYPLAAGDGDEPIYTAFDIGDVHFVMTDSRSMRKSEDYPGGGNSMLGAEQRQWLKQELLRGSRDYRLVVFVSAVPWIAPADASRDDWGGYAGERAELANFIADNGINNLMMLAGDAHMLAIDDGTNTDYSDSRKAAFPLLHAAALDRPGSEKGGPYSEGAYPGAGQYGLVTFRYEGGSLTVEMTGLNWKGETIVAYTFEAPLRRDH